MPFCGGASSSSSPCCSASRPLLCLLLAAACRLCAWTPLSSRAPTPRAWRRLLSQSHQRVFCPLWSECPSLDCFLSIFPCPDQPLSLPSPMGTVTVPTRQPRTRGPLRSMRRLLTVITMLYGSLSNTLQMQWLMLHSGFNSLQQHESEIPPHSICKWIWLYCTVIPMLSC